MALVAAASGGKNAQLKGVVVANNGLESVLRQCWLVSGQPTVGLTNYSTFGRKLFGDTPAANRFFDKVFSEIMSGGDMAYAGDFWKSRLPMESAAQIVENDIPVLLWSGYQDILDAPALKTYIALQNAYAKRPVWLPMEKNQPVSPKYQMIMGEWKHAQGLDAAVYLQWLETWLQGKDTG